MAAQDGDLEAFFLHSIPSLFRQAQRHLHSDNLNVLEYFERRSLRSREIRVQRWRVRDAIFETEHGASWSMLIYHSTDQ